jgi:RNA polymerase sigma factor (sigma-70 family)
MAAVEGAAHAGTTTQDLYSQYGKQIYSYCLHKLRSREEAEDAVQTTFMNAFRSLQRGATTQFEQAWLFKIAQNVCFARQTSSSRRLRLEAPNDFEVLQELVPSREGEQPLELMGLEAALEQMPDNQRRAILLREWQGLSYREIAEELELTQAAVEMLIFRARRTLAGALEEPEEGAGRRVRAGRRVGVLGSLVGALKTLFGGGAAIKAVSIAAAAIAVVGESANHTIVRHPAAARKVGPMSPVSAPADASAASAAQTTARSASAAVGHTAVVAPVTRHQHAATRVSRAHKVVRSSGATVSHAGGSARPRADVPLVTESASPTVAAVPPPPAPAPAPPAQQNPPKQHEPPKKDDDREPTIVSQPAATPPPVAATQSPPGSNGNALAHDKGDHGNGQADPPPAAPTTPILTVPAPEPAPPVPGDEGNGRGNANARGHSK